MSEQGLKPCPFCGRKAMTTFAQELRWRVVCKSCGHSVDGFSRDDYAAEAWNTRPIEDALQAENAQLKAQIEAMRPAIEALEKWYSDFLQNPTVHFFPGDARLIDAVQAYRKTKGG